MGFYFARYTQAEMAYRQPNYCCQFCCHVDECPKLLSSWVAWFVIDVMQIGLYIVKGMNANSGLFLYAGLYRVLAHGCIRLAAVATEDG